MPPNMRTDRPGEKTPNRPTASAGVRVPSAGYLVVMILLAVTGLVIASIQTKQHLVLNMFQAKGRSGCSLTPYLDCDAVYASRYSEVFGIPVSAWGAGAFGVVLVMVAFALWIGGDVRRMGLAAVFRILLVMVATSLVLAGISIGLLHVLCPLCTAVHLTNVLLLATCWLALGKPFAPIGGAESVAVPRRALLSMSALLALALMGVGAAASLGTFVSMQTTPVDVPREVQAFLAGKVYEIKNLDKIPMHGNPNAPITIVEFGDLECPACRGSYFLYQSMLKEYGDKVRLGFKHYPLDRGCNQTISSSPHPHACLAALASLYAHQQGKFWEFAEAVYGGPQPPDQEMLLNTAKRIGLDEKACFEFMKHQDVNGAPIIEDIMEARSLGLTTITPGLFFGTDAQHFRKAEGALVPILVRAYIEALLDQVHSK